MPQVQPSEVQTFASIKVVGIGGAGGSAINRMKDAGLTGVQFIAMNTDAQVHGVFSWVPDIVKEKIIKICNENLTEEGIA